MRKIIFVYSIFLFSTTLFAQNDPVYQKEIMLWHQERADALKQPDGWLNLEGLFWFSKGENSFGSDSKNTIVYENSSFPKHIGNFLFDGETVKWTKAVANVILTNDQGEAIKEDGPLVLTSANLSTVQFTWGTFAWVIIKRLDKVGIRFRNLNALTLQNFKGIPHFPIDKKWVFKAKLEPPIKNQLMIMNILGQETIQKNAGNLKFQIGNQVYSLDVIDEGGPQYFITFSDASSGNTTYGSGRFIDIPKPDAEGNTMIDFNKSYNPPCAFTPFATCPLPPPQNRLTVAIEAGEKNYANH